MKKKVTKKVEDEINTLVSKIILGFKSNLLSILLYGSNIKKVSKKNDIDLIIILKEKNSSSKDLRILRRVLQTRKDFVDLQLLYEKELINGDTFSLDTHGQFIIEELKKAIPLYGDNPFVGFFLSISLIQLSIMHKLQYYVFRARQEYLGYGFSTKDKSKDFHRKKIIMAMLDLLLAKQITINDQKNILKIFIKNFPGVIKDEFYSLLNEKKLLDIEEAMPIYEVLYDKALSIITYVYPEQRKPKIAKYKGVFFEYLIPKKVSTKIPFIILCDGLPSIPYQKNFMNILVNLGYGVLYPRYRGAWESEGIFLEKETGKDISDLAERLVKGLDLEGINLTATQITLIATSFGASVALSIAKDKNIKRIIALSPVLDFRKFSNLNSLKKFLQKMYPSVYRFTNITWDNLASGEAVPSSSSINRNLAPKIFLFGGKQDKEISSLKLISWGKRMCITTRIYDNLGHLSFSKIEGKLLEDIVNILNFSDLELQ